MSSPTNADSFGAKGTLDVGDASYGILGEVTGDDAFTGGELSRA